MHRPTQATLQDALAERRLEPLHLHRRGGWAAADPLGGVGESTLLRDRRDRALQDAAVLRDIDRMDDRMLRDLGRSRAQAEYQAVHRGETN